MKEGKSEASIMVKVWRVCFNSKLKTLPQAKHLQIFKVADKPRHK